MTSLFAVAKPWTYWIAPPLLAASLLLIVALAIGYYRKVAVPRFHWEQHIAQRARSEHDQHAVHPIGSPAGQPAAKAA